jgi:hypothetical protein
MKQKLKWCVAVLATITAGLYLVWRQSLWGYDVSLPDLLYVAVTLVVVLLLIRSIEHTKL